MKSLIALFLLTTMASVSAAGPHPIACNLGALTTSERSRHDRLAKELWSSVLEHRELRNGYAFRLPGRSLVSTAEWVALEHKCCPFFAFDLAQEEEQGAVWLCITGTPEVKAFIAEELKL